MNPLDEFTDLLNAVNQGDLPEGEFELGLSPSGSLYTVRDLEVFVLHSVKVYLRDKKPEHLTDLRLCQKAWRKWKEKSTK
jgi:hypothetical protein